MRLYAAVVLYYYTIIHIYNGIVVTQGPQSLNNPHFGFPCINYKINPLNLLWWGEEKNYFHRFILLHFLYESFSDFLLNLRAIFNESPKFVVLIF